MVVRVALAGGLRLTSGDRVMEAARLTRHDRLVLAYLTVERGRHVVRDELAELVWEQRIPFSWKPALRGIISRIRGALATADLPSTTLATGPGWYELTLPPETIVDVDVADRALVTAVEELVQGRADGARTAAEEVLAVARQPFLAGVSAAWVDQRQEWLDGLRLRALEVIAEAALRCADWSTALRSAEHALMLAPLRESAYRLVALAHCGAGNRGEALRALAECRRALAEELGADVSPETDALGAALLRGVASAKLLADQRPARDRPLTQSLHSAALLSRLVDGSTPFVDREAESARLDEVWRRVALGSPETVVVVGEAGAGKTRLLAEFAASVDRQGSPVLYGCGEENAPALGPLTEAVRGYLSASRPTAPNPAATAEAVREALGRATAGRPALLILDDIQWLDRDSVAMLRYVLRTPDRLPLLVVAGYRIGDGSETGRLPALLAALRRERPVTRVELAGLSTPALTQLVQAYIGQPPDGAMTAVIADATAGNPLFARELVRLLREEGRLVAVDGSLTLVDPGRLSVPDSVREVILARCQHLSLATRRVLAAAAVVGPEVDVATLEAMPDLSTVDVMAAAEEAVASGLMAERSTVPGRFAFVHGLVSEALYDGLSAVRRQRLHADAAAALELGAAPTSSAPRVAYHLLRGGPDLAERATAAAVRAGADAQHRHAYDEAAAHYAAALRVVGADPALRCRLRLDLAGARWRAGEVASARTDYAEAATEAYQAQRPDLAARAVFGAASHGPTLGRCDERVATQIGDVLGVLDAREPIRPRLLARLGSELSGVGDPGADDLCREALDLALAVEDHATTAYVLNCQNWVRLASPEDRSGLARADQMVVLAGLIGDRHMLLEGRLWRCTYLLRAGRLDEAEREAATLADVAVALRQPFYLRMPLRLRASLALLRSDYAEAAALAAEAYAIERRVHPADAEVHVRLHAAALGCLSGEWPEIVRSIADLPDVDSPHWIVIQALELAARGRVTAAGRGLSPLLADHAAGLGHGPLAAFSAALIIRAAQRDPRLGARIDIAAAASVLRPWRSSHIVAGCGVASLGPAGSVGP